jgi:hypothetical protein
MPGKNEQAVNVTCVYVYKLKCLGSVDGNIHTGVSRGVWCVHSPIVRCRIPRPLSSGHTSRDEKPGKYSSPREPSLFHPDLPNLVSKVETSCVTGVVT